MNPDAFWSLTSREDASQFMNVVVYLTEKKDADREDDPDFPLPHIPRSGRKKVQKMLTFGSSIPECCTYLFEFVKFEPKILTAVIQGHFDREIAEKYAFCSAIGWISHDEFWDADNFALLLEALVCSQGDLSDASKIVLKVVVSHFKLIPISDLPCGFASRLGDNLSAKHSDCEFSINIIDVVIKSAKKTGNKVMHMECVRALVKIISECEDELVGFDFSAVVSGTWNLIEGIEIDGIVLLAAVSDIEWKPEYADMWRLVADLVVTRLDNLRKTPVSAKCETPVIEAPDRQANWQVNGNTFRDFPEKRDPVSEKEVNVQPTLLSVLHEEQFNIYCLCCPLLHRRFLEMPVVFLEEFAKRMNSMETYFFFFSMLETLPQYRISQESLDRILGSDIMSPKFTLFYDTDFDTFNGLRNMLFGQMTSRYKDDFVSMIFKSGEHVLFFVENILRLQGMQFDLVGFVNEELIAIIARSLNAMIFSLSVSFSHEKYRAWSVLFVFAMSLTENKRFTDLAFSSLHFTNIFMRHFFHPPLRSLIWTTLRKYLTRPAANLDAIAKVCQSVFEMALSHDDIVHVAVMELIDCLEDVMSHRGSVAKELSIIMPAVMTFFLKFPTKELLNSTLNFLMHISFNCHDVQFGHAEMLDLGRAISSMEIGGLRETTKNFLMSLVAGNRNILNGFIIRNPSFILLILNASSDDITDLIEAFYGLSKYSIFNCMQCHEGELDLMLVQLLLSYPNAFTFMDCVFNHKFTDEKINDVIIPFLSLIFTYRCSPQALERFIGLAVPSVTGVDDAPHDGNVDDMHLDFSCISNRPRAWCNYRNDGVRSLGGNYRRELSLDILHRLQRHSLVGGNHQVKNGISLHRSRCRFGLFADRVMDNLTQTLASIHQVYFMYEAAAKPLCFPALSFPRVGEGFTFSCYLMIDKAVATMAQPILFWITDSVGTLFRIYTNGEALICEIMGPWGKVSASLASELPSCEWMMITLAVRPVNDDMIDLEYTLNKQEASSFLTKNPHFAGPAISVQIGGFMNNKVHTDQVYCFLGPYRFFDKYFDDSLVAKLYSQGMRQTVIGNNLLDGVAPVVGSYITSMKTVFHSYEMVGSLIPFFSFVNLTPPFFIEKVVDLLRYGDCEPYFGLISEFLKRCDRRRITYALYLRFFTLLTEKNSGALFTEILMNFGIWASCSEASHVRRIVNHWNHVLFAGFSENFANFTSFQRLISEICIYFWFSCDDIDIIVMERVQDLDIVDIRNTLNKLLVKFAEMSMTESDALTLVAHAVTTRDVKQRLSLLELLSSVVRFVPNPAACVIRLHSLLSTSRCDVFSETVLSIMLLCEEEDAARQVELIVDRVDKRHFRDDILEALLKVSERFPVVLVLACRIAVNLSPRSEGVTMTRFCDIIDHRGPRELAGISTWYIWPIVMLLRMPDADLTRFIPVLCKVMLVNAVNMERVMAFMDMIKLKCGYSVTSFQLKIIEGIWENFDDQSGDVTRIIHLCVRYLLFTFSDVLCSRQLCELFHESPYFEGESLLPSYPVRTICNMDDIYSVLEVEFTPLKFRVEVADKDRAVFDSILANVVEHVKKISLSDMALGKYKGFFVYLHQRTELDPDSRFKAMSSASAVVKHTQAVDAYFGSLFATLKSDIYQQLREIGEVTRASDSISDEIISLGESAVDEVKKRSISDSARAENTYTSLRAQYMNRPSIWRAFTGEQPSLRRSFRVLDNWSAPSFRNCYHRLDVDIEPVTVKGKPLLTTSATFVRSFIVHPVNYAVMTTGIVIAWNTKCIHIPGQSLRYVLYRPPNSYEFITDHGKAYLVEFPAAVTLKVISAVKQIVCDSHPIIQSSILTSLLQKTNATTEWVNGNLTNFEYIMKINFFGGFSFNSVGRYPIFPLVRLNKGDLRDLSEPLGVNGEVWLKLFWNFGKRSTSRSGPCDTTECENEGEIPITDDDVLITDHSDGSDAYENVESAHVDAEYDGVMLAGILANDSLELTPEFYSMPEAFTDLNVKPSEYEFVYGMRKVLESEHVSKNLHLWIDNTFGIKSHGTDAVFKNAHPQKKMNSLCRSTQTIHFDACTGNLTHAVIESASHDRVMVYMIIDNERVQRVSMHFDRESLHRSDVLFDVPLHVEHPIVGSVSQGVLLIDSASEEIHHVGPSGCRTVSKMSFPAEFCGDSGICWSEHLVYSLDKVKNGMRVFGVCKVSPAHPVCACANVRHKVTVVCVRSGKILVYDRLSGRYLREIVKCEYSVKRIVVCESFPFVVLQCRDALRVYSVYGAAIGELPITFEIALMVTGVSRDGFDYVFIADVTGRIFSLEVFTLELKEHMCCESRVSAMKYVDMFDSLIVFTQEGKGILISFPI